MKRRNPCEQVCTCRECVELARTYPRDGHQLTFPALTAPAPRRRPSAPSSSALRHRSAAV